MLTRITSVLGVGAVALTLFGFELSASIKDRRAENTLSVVMPVRQTDLAPVQLKLMEHFLLQQTFRQTLVRISESGRIVGDLATTWQFKDEGKTIEFKLRPEAKFSDGSRLTSQDVALSLSKHFWKGSPSIVEGYFGPLLKDHRDEIPVNSVHPAFETPDANTFVLKLKAPYPPILQVLSVPGFAIVPHKNQTNTAIGSGPLHVVSNAADGPIVLKTNPHYQGNRKGLAGMIVRFEEDEAKALQLLKNKEVDIALGYAFSKTADLPAHIALTKSNSLSIVHLYTNTNTKGLSDLATRELLFRHLRSVSDRSEKNSELLFRQDTFFPRGIMPPQYYERKTSSEPLSAEEKTKLRSALPDRLRITLMRVVFPENVTKHLKDALKDLQVEAEIDRVEVPELVRRMRSDDYDIIGGRYVGNFPDPDGYIDIILEDSPLHYGVFPTGQLKDQLGVHRFNQNRGERLTKYSEIFRSFEDQFYILPMFRLRIPVLHQKDLVLPSSSFRYEIELWKIRWKR